MNCFIRHLIALLVFCTIGSVGVLRCQSSLWRNYATTSEAQALVDQGDYLWIGTHTGVVRLTKSTGEMRVFNKANSGLIDNNINDLALDSAGNLWATVGINDWTGLMKFDGTTWTRSPITWCEAIAVAAGRDGNVWVGTNALGRLMRHGGGTLKTVYETNGGILEVAVDRNGAPWCVLPNGDIGRWNGAAFEAHAPEEYGLASVSTLFFDRAGRMWLGGDNVACVDGNRTVVFTTDSTKRFEAWVITITQDPAGNVWIAGGSSAAKYDGTMWTAYNDFLPSALNRRVIELVASSDGTIWCAGSDGIAKFSNGAWSWMSCNVLGVPSTDVASIVVDSAGIRWFATGGGLLRFDGNQWRAYTRENALMRTSNVRCLALDRTKGLWLGTAIGIVRFDGMNWYYPPYDTNRIVEGEVKSMVIDRAGNCWAAFARTFARKPAVARFDGTGWTIFTSDNSPIPAEANAMAVDSSGNVWIGVYGNGLARYDGAQWSVIDSTPDGLRLHAITSIMFDRRGVMYVTSYNFGVLEYDGTTWKQYTNETSPMVASDVATIAVDSRNRKWLGYSGIMGNDHGVQMMEGEWVAYSRTNSALPEGNIYAIAIDSSRNVWFSTREGLGVLMSDDGTTDAPLPPLVPSGIAARCLPQPVRNEGTIEYHVPGTSPVSVEIVLFDALGKMVEAVVREPQVPGAYRARFDAGGLATGTYFARLRIGREFVTLPLCVAGR